MTYPDSVPTPFWMSIEVFDGSSSSAGSWQDAWGDQLVENAITSGAVDWNWHRSSWGVIFEVAFADEDAWDAYKASLGVELALAAVPDPVRGLIVYRGRGGSSGTRNPRKPRPLIGSGAASLPLPLDEEWFLFNERFSPPEPRRLLASR
jgi:hypothetical protein